MSLKDRVLDVSDNLVLEPWIFDLNNGIYKWQDVIGRKGQVVDTNKIEASSIPVLPIALLENVDSKIEKIELAFRKRGVWRSVIVPRSVAANKTAIIKLSDSGIEVNSANAQNLVNYIAETVANNLDNLPHIPAKSVMGWHEGEFLPYADEIAFDGDENFGYLYRAVSQKGSYIEWLKRVRDLRKNLGMRLCMAASFSSPLIELIGENPFVFHLWGGTGAGKTVALMVAMSIWGDPAAGKLVRTMNMTANSMLSTAAFLRSLPFAGDELQTIKNRWGNYDSLIMCITEGIERGRMSFDRVNETKSWKCSFLFSGEEPCIKLESGGGAKNRVIEVECTDRLVTNGNETANFVRENYGFCGKEFIAGLSKFDVKEMYKANFRAILDSCDTTDKQAGAMAIMLTADAIASKLFWLDEQPLTIQDIAPYLSSANEVDVSERAYQYICGVIAENANSFDSASRTVWGKIEDGYAYINRIVLNRIMTEANFDLEAIKNKWMENGYLIRNNSRSIAFLKTIGGTTARYIKIKLASDYDPDIDEPLPFDP